MHKYFDNANCYFILHSKFMNLMRVQSNIYQLCLELSVQIVSYFVFDEPDHSVLALFACIEGRSEYVLLRMQRIKKY